MTPTSITLVATLALGLSGCGLLYQAYEDGDDDGASNSDRPSRPGLPNAPPPGCAAQCGDGLVESCTRMFRCERQLPDGTSVNDICSEPYAEECDPGAAPVTCGDIVRPGGSTPIPCGADCRLDVSVCVEATSCEPFSPSPDACRPIPRFCFDAEWRDHGGSVWDRGSRCFESELSCRTERATVHSGAEGRGTLYRSVSACELRATLETPGDRQELSEWPERCACHLAPPCTGSPTCSAGPCASSEGCRELVMPSPPAPLGSLPPLTCILWNQNLVLPNGGQFWAPRGYCFEEPSECAAFARDQRGIDVRVTRGCRSVSR